MSTVLCTVKVFACPPLKMAVERRQKYRKTEILGQKEGEDRKTA
jgi:hypothetical protein